jgi:hypothetical protein
MRGAHLTAAGSTARLSLSSRLPARVRAWSTTSSGPLASNPSTATVPATKPGMHVTQAAQAFGTAAKQRVPAGSSAADRRFLRRPGCRGPLRPYGTKKSVAVELTRWYLDRNGDENFDGPAACDSKGARARLLPPRWSYRGPDLLDSPRAGDRHLCRHHRRDLEAARGIDGVGCCRGPLSNPRRWPRPVTHHTGAEPFVVPFLQWCDTRRRVSSSAPSFVRGHQPGDGTSWLRCR